MTTPNYMAQLGATLVDRGFPILPIQPRSKKPGMYRQGAWHDYPKWSRHCEPERNRSGLEAIDRRAVQTSPL